jgi:hypothetical protein
MEEHPHSFKEDYTLSIIPLPSYFVDCPKENSGVDSDTFLKKRRKARSTFIGGPFRSKCERCSSPGVFWSLQVNKVC